MSFSGDIKSDRLRVLKSGARTFQEPKITLVPTGIEDGQDNVNASGTGEIHSTIL